MSFYLPKRHASCCPFDSSAETHPLWEFGNCLLKTFCIDPITNGAALTSSDDETLLALVSGTSSWH